MEPETQTNEEIRIETIIQIITGNFLDDEIRDALNDYHENDIAEAFQQLDTDGRKKLYRVLGTDKVSEIFTYIDDVSDYLKEITPEQAADVLESMDADEAVDALEDIENVEEREQIISLMDSEAKQDIRLINSYEDDEIGSKMTTNFIIIAKDFTVKQAMRSLCAQAEENDNINTIYVHDENENYCGAIELKDLIRARETKPLEDIIQKNYPSINAKDKTSDVIEQLKDYAEDSIPVLNEYNEVIGAITSELLLETVDEEMADDYAKLAGLTSEEDLNEKLHDSMKKRLPWLILLLFLGMGVSSVVGIFEGLVSQVAIIVCFQSLILGMAGNVGTQSLAVTVRVLMDENIQGSQKLKFILKEIRVGFFNGLLLGIVAFAFVGLYTHFIKDLPWTQGFKVSACVGSALLLAMTISSMVGSVVPMFFHKIKVDPAVASGPLITTVNDLVAVITYYGLATLFLIKFANPF
ncbi:MAG: magnesium transporter [Treponema sp.]|nr:magnesium transporter [Treponema sp.]